MNSELVVSRARIVFTQGDKLKVNSFTELSEELLILVRSFKGFKGLLDVNN